MNARLILLSTLGITTATLACGKPPAARGQASGAETASPIAVQSAEVRATSEGAALEIPAAIESTRRATLSSRLAASIVSLDHREGDAVNAGAVLVRLESAGLSAALAAAEASDTAAARDLARAEALLGKGAATRNEVENATTAATRARSAVIAAREALSYAAVRAPFAGRITRKVASVGDTVSPGQALLEIEGPGGLEVTASIEASVYERLKVGQKIDVRIDGVRAPVTAVIHTLAPSADPTTHRFTLRADIRGADSVRAGLFARISVPVPGTERRILVPAGAVIRRGGLTGVYVIREGRAWLRWIAPGDTFGDALEARAGLEPNERVALDPARLHDGAAVTEARQ